MVQAASSKQEQLSGFSYGQRPLPPPVPRSATAWRRYHCAPPLHARHTRGRTGLASVALPIRYLEGSLRRHSLSRVILGLTDSAPSRRHVSSQPALSPHLSPSATQLRAADGPLALRGRGRGQGGRGVGGARARSGPLHLDLACSIACLLCFPSLASACFHSPTHERASEPTALDGATHFPRRGSTLTLESSGEANTSFGDNAHNFLNFSSFRKSDKNGVRSRRRRTREGRRKRRRRRRRGRSFAGRRHEVIPDPVLSSQMRDREQVFPPRSRGDGGREDRGQAGQVFLFRGKNRGRQGGRGGREAGGGARNEWEKGRWMCARDAK